MKIGKDKWMHAGVCFAATALTFIGMHILFPFAPSIVACMLFPAGLGIGKEYGDSKAAGNSWSWADILADVLGTVAFVVIALAAHWLPIG